MTNAALGFWFAARGPLTADLRAEWLGFPGNKGLRKRINSNLDTRNALAHFTAYVAPQHKREHEKIFLEPAWTDTRHEGGSERKHHTVTEIRAAGNRFVALGREMHGFVRAMVQLEDRLGLTPRPSS